MKTSIGASVVLLLAVCCAAGAGLAVRQDQETGKAAGQEAQAVAPAGQTLEAKASLIMGYDLVAKFKSMGVELDVDSLIQGIRLAADGKEMPLSDEDCSAVAQSFNQHVETRRVAAARMEMDKNLAVGTEFQQQYCQTNSVVALPSGVIHRVIRAGTGATPGVQDIVKIHYTGKLVDGTVFDTSIGDDPAEFPVSGVIRGMTECLLKMKVGEKCEMILPADTAYGADGPPSIGPGQTLVFEVELLEIMK